MNLESVIVKSYENIFITEPWNGWRVGTKFSSRELFYNLVLWVVTWDEFLKSESLHKWIH